MKVIISLLSVVLFGFIAWSASFMVLPASNNAQMQTFDVAPGMGFGQIAKGLENEGLITDSFKMRVLAKLKGYDSRIRIGEYELSPSMRPTQILEVLASGRSKEYSFTVPEGWNMYEIAMSLEEKGFGSKEEFLRLCKDTGFIKSLLGESIHSLEGYLYPETYRVTKYTKEKELIRLMVSNFKANFAKLIGIEGSGMSRHEIVTMASVIEKETGAPEERPLISSVFHNRLKKRMRLQSDPTIIYGIFDETGKFIKNIRKKDIRRPTRYNTYTVKALPFGPIANPGLHALQATLKPAESPYFYFVSRNNGTHVFSETYDQHKKAVRDFQLNPKMRKGRSWRDLNKKRN